MINFDVLANIYLIFFNNRLQDSRLIDMEVSGSLQLRDDLMMFTVHHVIGNENSADN